MPVWHVSVSIQHVGEHDGATGFYVLDPDRCERIAVELLVGVGGDVEWWCEGEFNRAVCHLRVPITPAENLILPPGCTTHDAGKTGPMRPRTRA